MDEKKLRKKYNSKAKDNFNTMFKLFLFDRAATNLLESKVELKEFKDFQIKDFIIKEYVNEY